MDGLITKGFWMAVIAGVVAAAIFKTLQQNQAPIGTRATTLGFVNARDPRYTGEPVGIPIFVSIAAPSGHGDATMNANVGSGILPGQCASVADGVYEPTLDTNYAVQEWNGGYL